MRDIPVFTVPSGIATLILREIPPRGEAYVLLRGVFTSQEELLTECARFCRAAGAERVYYGGADVHADGAAYATLLPRSILRTALPPTGALAVPIRPDEADEWQRLYRERFRSVPAAASVCDARGACFVVESGRRIGLGAVSGDTLRAVAALERGRGADCVCALAALAQGERLRLTCAAENRSAMRLYDRLGFDAGEAVERWYAFSENGAASCPP